MDANKIETLSQESNLNAPRNIGEAAFYENSYREIWPRGAYKLAHERYKEATC